MDLKNTLAVLVICAVALVDSQFFNQGLGNTLNLGGQRGFGQNTAFLGGNLNRVGLQTLNNRGLNLNNRAGLRGVNQLGSRQGINANNFVNAENGRNLDFANSASSRNNVALQFASNNEQREDSALSFNEGARINTGNQLQALDNFAQNNILDAQTANQGLFANNNALNFNGLQRNDIGFQDNVFGQDGGFALQSGFNNLRVQPFGFTLFGKKK